MKEILAIKTFKVKITRKIVEGKTADVFRAENLNDSQTVYAIKRFKGEQGRILA